jgi:serine phosphatase RsbU (regulator of sigma subunit)
METLSSAHVDWAMVAAPYPGERVLGDAYAVLESTDTVLLAVVDGVGHGADAAAVARACVAVVTAHVGLPIPALILRCHERMRGTRGATITLASFDLAQGELSWAGVGNVSGVLAHRGESGAVAARDLWVRNGLLGAVLPPLQLNVTRVSTGDVLVLATDGVNPDFHAAVPAGGTPKSTAERILGRFARGTDDALVLVGRYVGARG